MYVTDFQYYANSGQDPTDANWGSYQFVSLRDIVNNFMLVFVGNDKQINNIERHVVIFHAKQAIKEMNFDAFRNTKVLEQRVDDNLKIILPPDFVNMVDISLEVNGTLFPMTQNLQPAITAVSYRQNSSGEVVFDPDGNVYEDVSVLEEARLSGLTEQIYGGPGQYYGHSGWCIDGYWYFSRSFAGNSSTMNSNAKYQINKKSGVIDFSSLIVGQTVVLKYISDGMERGIDQEVSVNKMAEKAIYNYIRWAVLDTKYGIPQYEKNAVQRQWISERNNAKIRFSGIHSNELLMVLRNQGNWIK